MTFQGQDAPSASRCWSLIANQSRRCRWQSCGLVFLFLSHRKASIKAQYLPPHTTLCVKRFFSKSYRAGYFPQRLAILYPGTLNLSINGIPPLLCALGIILAALVRGKLKCTDSVCNGGTKVLWSGRARCVLPALPVCCLTGGTELRDVHVPNSGLILRCRAGTRNPKSLLPPILLLGEEATDSPSDARGLPACCHELESAGKWE